MSFKETNRAHAEGWKTGFCQCDWCKAARIVKPTFQIDDKWRYSDEQECRRLDDRDASLNQEYWWASDN